MLGYIIVDQTVLSSCSIRTIEFDLPQLTTQDLKEESPPTRQQIV